VRIAFIHAMIIDDSFIQKESKIVESVQVVELIVVVDGSLIQG
jgi:hypothetical protein